MKHVDRWAYGADMDDERRQRRMDRVGQAIRIELAVGFLSPVVLAFIFLAAPGFTGGGMFEPGYVTLLPWIGGAGVIFGLVWLVRLSRIDPEAGERSWRYRA
jgi:peptidoglycan/LPS O-acetylase OafA/YrhL